MRKILLVLFGSMLLLQCSDPVQNESGFIAKQTPNLVSKSEIDKFILTTLQEKNEFNWGMVSDEVLWSAAMHSDSVLTIGYKPALEKEISARIASININSPAWKEARQSVLADVVNAINAIYRSLK